MAEFTKTAQTILGGISVGTSIATAFGIGSRLSSPSPSQQPFEDIRSQVYADVRRWGIRKANLGYVTFSVPNTLSTLSNSKEILLLSQNRANQFPIPSVSLATSDIRRYGVGPFEKKPYLPTFTDVTIDFIGDSAGNIHKFFYIWMNNIVNFFELPRENSKKDVFNKNPFAVEYKDNYTTRISLLTFSDNQEKATEVFLENAFPISISEIQYDWSNENQLVRFGVTFSFTHWTYDIQNSNFGFNVPQVETTSGNFDYVYNFLIQLYPAAQALELATRRPREIEDVLNIVNAGRTGLSPITRYF